MIATMSFPRASLNRSVAFALAAVVCLVLCIGFIMTATMDVAYCEETTAPTESPDNILGDTIQGVISNATSRLYTLMRSIVIPIIILFFGVAGYKLLFGGTKGTEEAKNIMIKCFFAVILVVAAPFIGYEIGKWFKDVGTGNWDHFNPLA